MELCSYVVVVSEIVIKSALCRSKLISQIMIVANAYKAKVYFYCLGSSNFHHSENNLD